MSVWYVVRIFSPRCAGKNESSARHAIVMNKNIIIIIIIIIIYLIK